MQQLRPKRTLYQRTAGAHMAWLDRNGGDDRTFSDAIPKRRGANGFCCFLIRLLGRFHWRHGQSTDDSMRGSRATGAGDVESARAAATQIELAQHTAPHLTPLIHIRQRPRNARISDSTNVSHTRSASYVPYKEPFATLRRHQSRQIATRACLSELTHRCAPNILSSRRLSYAQDASIA